MATSKSNSRKIVIAMDGSEYSDYAFDYYVENLHRTTDEVVFIYCADITIAIHSPLRHDANHLEKVITEQQKHMDEITDELNTKIQKSGVKGRIIRLMNKDIGHAIVSQAENEQATLIVTGTRGRGRLRRTFLGSVSEYIVNHSSIPVLVCRRPSEKK
ncbi:hypothetical protein SNE40_013902 [Patella caerulea]|uniref:UspA domain-containing protein n=1 Tax=Patella caerulea TaxID=87958 RepID=A0AAN8PBS3_PATCE